jgi:cholesterol oxidase
MDETHFDAVIVGSGFGGSVMAYRLAEAGKRVCLLERGKAYPPNSFPRSPHKLSGNFWDPSEGLYGMFNVWSFRHVEALVASGLGGGSLIYANVLIRKDERWFVQEDLSQGGYEYWPVTRADLDPHYDRVEEMLNAQRYPFEHPPYGETAKTQAFREAAERLNLEWQLPKLAVTFANPGQAPALGEPIAEARPNLHGRARHTCRLCGECMLGCNYGSKNTLDFNYLTEARRLGAELWTCCEVRSLEPRQGGGYTVRYVRHDPEKWEGSQLDTSRLPAQTITADRLVLSAGSLGSTFLLLKNRRAFPGLSQMLGRRFSGNGDFLGFALRSRHRQDNRLVPRLLDPGRGTVITSAIRVPDLVDGGQARGHYVEDAGYPEHFSWLLGALDSPGAARRFARFVRRRLRERLSGRLRSDLSADFAQLFDPAETAASSIPLLGMGRDVPDGHLELDRNGYLSTDWAVDGSEAYFQGVKKTMTGIARALNATVAFNPTFKFRRVVTVHTLGGCPMGRNEREGVVDAYGRVFNYPGLYVADGSVMPGPVGPNPSLTIAALADRFADRLVDER